MPARRTAGNGSGSSAPDWTPSPFLPSRTTTGPLLPTPKAHDQRPGVAGYAYQANNGRSSNLNDTVAALLPTPRKSDADKGGRGDFFVLVRGNHPGHFRAPAGYLPTPTASTYGSSGNGCPGDGRERYGHAGTPSLSTLARGLLPTPLKSAAGAPRAPRLKVDRPHRDPAHPGSWRGDLKDHCLALLPTPTKTDSRLGGSRNGPGSKAHPGVSLSDLVLTGSSKGRTLTDPGLAPSPSARDWKSTKAGPAMLARGNARPLSEWIGSTLGLDGAAVVLAISEWLMGYPPGWCASASPPMATRSCRTSPK
jgi:hypothetical protein